MLTSCALYSSSICPFEINTVGFGTGITHFGPTDVAIKGTGSCKPSSASGISIWVNLATATWIRGADVEYCSGFQIACSLEEEMADEVYYDVCTGAYSTWI